MRTRRCLKLALGVLLFWAVTIYAKAYGALPDASDPPGGEVHFVPNSQEFWDFSKNWPTNFGPAYRDTVNAPTNFVPCTGQYALCAESGPEPLPCKMTPDSRFADCTCTVQTGLNFVQITSILNEKVYQETLKVCGADGAKCFLTPDKAPVCQTLQNGALIPGAELISDFNPGTPSAFTTSKSSGADQSPFTICPKAPYAGCMTAPCKFTSGGEAECSCPIFWGIFQLPEPDAQCSLGDDLVWSASYVPALDSQP